MQPAPVSTPRRYPVCGRITKYSGLLLGLIGVLVAIWGAGIDDPLVIGFGLILIPAGIYNWLIGWRLIAISVEEMRRLDHRAPILFLRSFRDDERDYSVAGWWSSVCKSAAIQARTGLAPLSSPWGPTMQIQLASLFRDLGPYVAIGKPGEKIAGTGAARTYVSDEEWKQRIADWLREARLVVLRAGSTAGISTELAMLRAWNNPERILVILPQGNKAYEAFRQVAIGILPKPLPDQLPGALYMCFDHEWNASALPSTGTLLQMLSPFLAQNGIGNNTFSWRYKLWNENVLFLLVLVMLGMVVGLVLLSAFLG